MQNKEKIMVSVDSDNVFFHVFGDARKYYDLDALLLRHEELSVFVKENRYFLERQLLQRRELFNLV